MQHHFKSVYYFRERQGMSQRYVNQVAPANGVVDDRLTFQNFTIDRLVATALEQQPDPGNGPLNRQFVPNSARSQVLQWIHSSRFANHRTISLIKLLFWWTTLERDTKEFVSACSICATNKASHQSPAGMLQPLAIPSQHWSHIALDFVTGLPPSEGNTTIVTIVDRFSKSAQAPLCPGVRPTPH